jgi:hypothetical protein
MIKKKTIVTPAKKLTPATIFNQKKWSNLPIAKKNQLRKKLPDTDKDGVPDKYDCHPQNKRKQESFLSQDSTYLEATPKIKLGKYINHGHCGDIYELAGNKRLTVKVPRHFADTKKSITLSKETRSRELSWKRDDLNEEMKAYNDLDLNNKPLFTPTRFTSMVSKFDGKEYPCLIRPKVTPINFRNAPIPESIKRRVTDNMLEDLRRKLIVISYQGIALDDGMQIGIDLGGRFLIYDAGRMKTYKPGSDIPFKVNNEEWQDFLLHLGKADTYSDMMRHGEVTKN